MSDDPQWGKELTKLGAMPSPSSSNSESAAPTPIGKCQRCGYTLYQGLAHHCATAPMSDKEQG